MAKKPAPQPESLRAGLERVVNANGLKAPVEAVRQAREAAEAKFQPVIQDWINRGLVVKQDRGDYSIDPSTYEEATSECHTTRCETHPKLDALVHLLRQADIVGKKINTSGIEPRGDQSVVSLWRGEARQKKYLPDQSTAHKVTPWVDFTISKQDPGAVQGQYALRWYDKEETERHEVLLSPPESIPLTQRPADPVAPTVFVDSTPNDAETGEESRSRVRKERPDRRALRREKERQGEPPTNLPGIEPSPADTPVRIESGDQKTKPALEKLLQTTKDVENFYRTHENVLKNKIPKRKPGTTWGQYLPEEITQTQKDVADDRAKGPGSFKAAIDALGRFQMIFQDLKQAIAETETAAVKKLPADSVASAEKKDDSEFTAKINRLEQHLKDLQQELMVEQEELVRREQSLAATRKRRAELEKMLANMEKPVK